MNSLKEVKVLVAKYEPKIGNVHQSAHRLYISDMESNPYKTVNNE